MNIYQNGAFSEILHKLTKYQALAASSSNSSKQSLYSQKVQEYKNKLDKMNFNQSGGVSKEDIRRRIGELVPAGWKTAFNQLRDAHNAVALQINELAALIRKKIVECGNSGGAAAAQTAIEQKHAAELGVLAAQNETKLSVAGADAAKRLGELNAQIVKLQEQLKAARGNKKEGEKLQTELDRLRVEATTETARLAAALEKISGLEQQIAQINREKDTRIAELDALKTELTGVQQQLAAALAENVKLGAITPNCQTEIEKLLNEINEYLNERFTGDNVAPTNFDSITGPMTTALNQLRQLATSS
jgi:phosphoglycolate phosphatase-like HAD superfamily hydrolase